jgi:hypothetical protein
MFWPPEPEWCSQIYRLFPQLEPRTSAPREPPLKASNHMMRLLIQMTNQALKLLFIDSWCRTACCRTWPLTQSSPAKTPSLSRQVSSADQSTTGRARSTLIILTAIAVEAVRARVAVSGKGPRRSEVNVSWPLTRRRLHRMLGWALRWPVDRLTSRRRRRCAWLKNKGIPNRKYLFTRLDGKGLCADHFQLL